MCEIFIILVAEFNNWWLNKAMQKTYFQDRKDTSEKKVQKKLFHYNILINRKL
jgi:hypothetical protein